MTIIDRYLLFLFIKIFLVCFLSFSGLFIVIHLFTNLDEMMAIKASTGWKSMFVGFYLPRVAEIFDKTAAVWALMAAVFAVSLMQRRSELTAIEATGIRRSRTLRAIFFFTLVIVAVAAANRELILPQVRDQLVRKAQDWQKQETLPMGTYHDLISGVKIRGQELSLNHNRILRVEVQLPALAEASVSHIQADLAHFHEPSANRPSGLWLFKVTQPVSLQNLRSHASDSPNVPLVYWPSEHKWLKPDECFVPCQFDAYQAAYGQGLSNYQSTKEMMAELRKPRTWYGNQAQINVHARLIQPILDFSLLVLGLPLVTRRGNKNIFYAAGVCFLLVGIFALSILGSHALGNYSILQPAALAAWLPAIIFVPLAIVSWRNLDD